MDISELKGVADNIRGQVAKVVIGQAETVDLMLVALFCGGHVLLEGPPGTAKSATLRPLKISSVVFQTGPSVVMTRNLASGSRSPTLIGMGILSRWGSFFTFLVG